MCYVSYLAHLTYTPCCESLSSCKVPVYPDFCPMLCVISPVSHLSHLTNTPCCELSSCKVPVCPDFCPVLCVMSPAVSHLSHLICIPYCMWAFYCLCVMHSITCWMWLFVITSSVSHLFHLACSDLPHAPYKQCTHAMHNPVSAFVSLEPMHNLYNHNTIFIFFFLYTTNINILMVLLLLGGCCRMRRFGKKKKKKA